MRITLWVICVNIVAIRQSINPLEGKAANTAMGLVLIIFFFVCLAGDIKENSAK